MPERHRTIRRLSHLGCSQLALLTALLVAGQAAAYSAHDLPDPDAPIRTNHLDSGQASSGEPELEAAPSSSLTGVPELMFGSERSRPKDASPDPDSGTSARSAERDASVAAAETQSAPRSPQVYAPLDVPLLLNGRFLGMISVDVDLQGDGLIDVERLLAILEPVVTAETLARLRTVAAGRPRVPFDAFETEDLALKFSSATLELNATIGGIGLIPSEMRLSGPRTLPDPASFPQPSPFSIGANVSLAQRYLHSDSDLVPMRGAVDAVMHWGGFTGLSLITGAEYDGSREDSKWRRTETRLVKDFYGPAIRAMAGEFTPVADGFQGSGRLVGIGIERAYSVVRPFQNIRPTGRQEFTLDRESNVDVIINGLKTQTLRLREGRYSVSDFPFATGSNQVQLVVDDLSGRNEIAVFDIFSGADLLGKGIVDFGIAAGRYEGSSPYEYDGPTLATGFIRKGWSDSVTLGANAQASSDVQQIGGMAVWGSRFGLLLVELAASRNRLLEQNGMAASVSYRHTLSLREKDDLRVTANVSAFSENFSDPFQPNRSNADAWRASAMMQWRAPWDLGLSVGVSMSEARLDSRRRHQIDLGVSRSFGRVSVVSNISFTNAEDQDEVRFAVGLSVPLGPRWNAQARYDTVDSRSEVIVGRYATGELNDVSGEVRFTNDDRSRDLSGRLDYVNNRFEAQLNHNRRYDRIQGGDPGVESSLAVRSFIGFSGGLFGIGRPVDDAFIIAPVHKSLKEAKVTLVSGTRAVARSGLFGPPVVPIQRAYGINAFEILVDPLPTGYDLGSASINVFPPFGAGYRQQIGSDASRIAVGVLTGPDGPLVLASGTVLAEGASEDKARAFFTNRSGRFVADQLAPGRYSIFIRGNKVAEFVIPETSEGIVNVGTLEISSR